MLCLLCSLSRHRPNQLAVRARCATTAPMSLSLCLLTPTTDVRILCWTQRFLPLDWISRAFWIPRTLSVSRYLSIDFHYRVGMKGSQSGYRVGKVCLCVPGQEVLSRDRTSGTEELGQRPGTKRCTPSSLSFSSCRYYNYLVRPTSYLVFDLKKC